MTSKKTISEWAKILRNVDAVQPQVNAKFKALTINSAQLGHTELQAARFDYIVFDARTRGWTEERKEAVVALAQRHGLYLYDVVQLLITIQQNGSDVDKALRHLSASNILASIEVGELIDVLRGDKEDNKV